MAITDARPEQGQLLSQSPPVSPLAADVPPTYTRVPALSAHRLAEPRLMMESPISPSRAELHTDCECDSIDVVGDSPIGSKEKVTILDPFEFLESPEADANKTERPLFKLMMESQISPTGAGLHADSECDSIDLVGESPDGSKEKVKILDPFEFLESPEADTNKTERPLYKSILKHLPSEDALLETTPQCTAQWHPLSPVIPTCNPGPNGTQELPVFAMSNPGGPEAGGIVPYVRLAGDGTPFYMSSGGLLFPAATGEMPAHQIHTPGSGLPQGMVVAASSTTMHIPQQMAEEVTRKRELRLMKNREAAKACRLRRKEYIRCLENHIALLEVQNMQLVKELETYRSIYG